MVPGFTRAAEFHHLPPVLGLDQRGVNRLDGIVKIGFRRRQQRRIISVLVIVGIIILFPIPVIVVVPGLEKVGISRPGPAARLFLRIKCRVPSPSRPSGNGGTRDKKKAAQEELAAGKNVLHVETLSLAAWRLCPAA